MVVKKIYVTCAVFLLDRVGAPLAPEKYRPVNAYPVCIPGLHSHVWFPGSSGQGLLIVEAAKFIVRVFPVHVKRRTFSYLSFTMKVTGKSFKTLW